jgi:hypothetical protein
MRATRLNARVVLYSVCAAAAAVVTWQRGRPGHWHTTLLIFRQSFWHLFAGLNLYAPYPAEQGTAAESVFKYSPTAALLFAPFAVVPYAVALFAWSLFSAGLLCYALLRLLPGWRGALAAALVLPELFASMQAVSSNAVVAALIVLAFIFLEQRKQTHAALAIGVGAAMKVFPLAAAVLALFHPRRRRFAVLLAGVGVALVVLPLVVTSAARLVQQYRWWQDIERFDAHDLAFGDSVMHLIRQLVGGTWPNWPLQAAGTVLLLLPMALRRDQWDRADFRLRCLASLLVYALLFNHQAERPSMVIGATGVAIWFVATPGLAAPTAFRALVALPALVGLRTPPLALAWIVMQAELYGWPLPSLTRAGFSRRTKRSPAAPQAA